MTQDNLAQWDLERHSVAEIVAALDLQPHPEGGWYRETFRSGLKVRRADGAQRDAFTQILFLLGPGEISRWHRVNHADESWCCLAGDPLALLMVGPAPEGLQEWRLLPGSAQTVVVPAGVWQAARGLGRWSLMVCAVAPGFDFDDFQMLSELSPSEHPAAALAEYR
ncbi:cupin domain-containing protein [Synechococcus sp. W4D4]|uniref:cupin domain-containing protein n=1 Tax=Synechococcus sp. W4D4 TaxID=3392294 RepID=UPI0039EAAE7E